VAALAASGIEVETDTSTLGQLAKPTQQLIARHERWIAVAAACEIAERAE
jgi:hypothetical protein